MSSWFPRPPLSGASRIPLTVGVSCDNRAYYSVGVLLMAVADGLLHL